MTTTKTYKYAVICSQGMYGSGDTVRVAFRTNDLEKARKRAEKLTREYQDGMRPYGGSSGGYRVIAWDSADTTLSGYSADRTPSL